jgi:catechol 2,3-dioxygenase-like lactoylglutathione lyase family enzyme
MGGGKEREMFSPTRVVTALPAQDWERAKSFYADKLGLKPIEERGGESLYEVGTSQFVVFPTHGKPSSDHTQMSFEVDDLADAMTTLRENGVTFEEYDLPGFKTENGVIELDGEKAAWFKDSEGNVIAIAERTDR